MPLYEYWCHHCQCKNILYLPAFPQSLPACPQCGNNTLRRLFSTFSVRKADRGVYEDILGDSRLKGGLMANEPRALAEWNRRMSREEKVTPEYEEMVDKMERGEMPKERSGKGKREATEKTD
ncbi:FmdB family zinc ribbon protein [Chloroflexota bacterium]